MTGPAPRTPSLPFDPGHPSAGLLSRDRGWHLSPDGAVPFLDERGEVECVSKRPGIPGIDRGDFVEGRRRQTRLEPARHRRPVDAIPALNQRDRPVQRKPVPLAGHQGRGGQPGPGRQRYLRVTPCPARSRCPSLAAVGLELLKAAATVTECDWMRRYGRAGPHPYGSIWAVLVDGEWPTGQRASGYSVRRVIVVGLVLQPAPV